MFGIGLGLDDPSWEFVASPWWWWLLVLSRDDDDVLSLNLSIKDWANPTDGRFPPNIILPRFEKDSWLSSSSKRLSVGIGVVMGLNVVSICRGERSCKPSEGLGGRWGGS